MTSCTRCCTTRTAPSAASVDIVAGDALEISDDACCLDDPDTLLAFGGTRWGAASTSAEDRRA